MWLLFLLLAGVCVAQERDREFARLADRFFDEVLFAYDPVQGTQAGFHQYDAQLPSGSRAEIEAADRGTAQVRTGSGRLRPARTFGGGHGRPRTGAGADSRAVARRWKRSALGEESGYLLVGRLERHVRDHEPQVRAAGGAAEIGHRAREADPAAIPIGAREPEESAAHLSPRSRWSRLPGIVSFFQNDVPAAFKDVTDAALLAEFRRRNQAVIDALNAYEAFLKTRPAAAFQGRFPHRRRELSQEAAVRRDGGYPARPAARDRLGRTCGATRRSSSAWRRRSIQTRTAEQILNESQKDHPAAGQAAAEFSRRARRPARLHRDAAHRDDSVARCRRSWRRRRRSCAR